MSRLGIDMQTVFGLPPVEHVKLAAELGCGHISTGAGPVPWKLDRFADWSLRDDPALRREMRAAMRDLGVGLSVMEGFGVRPGVEARDRVRDLDLAAELGAKRASAVCMEPDRARGLDQLTLLAELAHQRDILLTLEFAPPHAINSLASAIGAIREIGHPNIRLVIDAMHFFRSAGDVDELRALDPALVGYVQLCDAPLKGKSQDYLHEACFERLAPGDGELPLIAMVDALSGTTTPIGLEAPMQAEMEKDWRDAVERIVLAGRAILARADA